MPSAKAASRLLTTICSITVPPRSTPGMLLLLGAWLHYCFERMGQNFLSDIELISWISERVVAEGEKFLRSDAPNRPEPLILESTSLRVEAAWIADYEKSCDRNYLQMMIRLKRRGSGGHRDRFVYIRYGSVSNRLQHGKTWRTAFGGLSKIREKRPHRRLTVLNLPAIFIGSRSVPVTI